MSFPGPNQPPSNGGGNFCRRIELKKRLHWLNAVPSFQIIAQSWLGKKVLDRVIQRGKIDLFRMTADFPGELVVTSIGLYDVWGRIANRAAKQLLDMHTNPEVPDGMSF